MRLASTSTITDARPAEAPRTTRATATTFPRVDESVTALARLHRLDQHTAQGLEQQTDADAVPVIGVLGAALHALGPRRPGPAPRMLAGIVSAGALVLLTVVLVRPQGPSPVDVATVAALLVTAAGLVRLPEPAAAVLCTLTHVLTPAVLLALDLASQDATVVGQVFFYLPVLSASTHLRVPGIVLVTALAVAAEATVVLVLLPLELALTDLAFVGATLVLTAAALGRAGVLQDRLVTQLERQATVDPLTGLLTRRVLDAATASAVAAASRPRAAHTCLLLVDLDRFKLVNDRYGHVAGDDALAHVAALLRTTTRAGDVVARMGGDELAVLLPGCDDVDALTIAEDLVQAVRATPLVLEDGRVVPLTVSVGLASAPGHASTPRDLYGQADVALYVAKRAGRDQVGHVAPPPTPAVSRQPAQEPASRPPVAP